MVPEVGLEPTWALSPLDFESSAYTNFATLAQDMNNKTLRVERQLKMFESKRDILTRKKL